MCQQPRKVFQTLDNLCSLKGQPQTVSANRQIDLPKKKKNNKKKLLQIQSNTVVNIKSNHTCLARFRLVFPALNIALAIFQFITLKHQQKMSNLKAKCADFPIK